MTKPTYVRRPSPRACPKCGSCDVLRDADRKLWHCNRCEHEQATAFPKVGSLHGQRTAHRWQANVGQGSHRYMPAGNKHS